MSQISCEEVVRVLKSTLKVVLHADSQAVVSMTRYTCQIANLFPTAKLLIS